MSAELRALSLPPAWFDRPSYRPRVAGAGGDEWLLRSASLERVATLGEEPFPRSIRDGLAPSPEQVASTFRSLGEEWGLELEEKARENLDALAESDTLLVVTGQQPGFLGGPLLTLYKALSAIALAERAEASWGRRCVPVFWVASEDHDLEEVRAARFPEGSGGERTFRLPHPPGRRPLSSLAIDESSEEVLAEVEPWLERRRHGREARELVALYRGRTVASGFAAMLAALLSRHGLLVIAPEALRPLARPLLADVVERAEGVREAVAEGYRAVEALGRKPRVAARFPLFLIEEGQRHHLEPEAGGLRIDGGGRSIARAELEEILRSRPEVLSAGALLRPLVQETVLPVALSVGGPAEVEYFQQLPPLADLLGVPRPRIALRFQGTVVDGRAARAWRRLDTTTASLAAARRPEQLVPVPESARDVLADAHRLEAAAAALERDALAAGRLDEPGRRRIARSTRKLLESARSTRERIDRELRRGHEDLAGAAEVLWSTLFPGENLQERSTPWLEFFSRHGPSGIDALLDVVRHSSLDVVHHLIVVASTKAP